MKKLNQSGAVAMISVVIFATIITILVTAYARTIVSQQRQSTNYDLSTRAYYAAEAGVQDAIRSLKADPGSTLNKEGQNTCKSNSGGYLDGDSNSGNGQIGGSDLAYTCQLVDVRLGSIEDMTSPNSGLWRINPEQLPSPSSGYLLNVSWSKEDQNDGQQLSPRENNDKLFPPIGGWVNNGALVHPLLRVSFISAPNNLGSRSDIKQQVYFLNPALNADGGTPGVTFPNEQDREKTVVNASCPQDNVEYACSQAFTVDKSWFEGGNNVYVVIHSEYSKAKYKISAADRVGSRPVDLVGTAANIDVTAKAGNVFRRIRQTVDLGSSYKQSWFDASGLVVGDGICKLFSIGESPGQFNSECTP